MLLLIWFCWSLTLCGVVISTLLGSPNLNSALVRGSLVLANYIDRFPTV